MAVPGTRPSMNRDEGALPPDRKPNKGTSDGELQMTQTPLKAQEAQARADVYGFLASQFMAEPTEESVRGLTLLAAEEGIECPTALTLEELRQEFMELFVVPNARFVAPYESVFRDERPVPAVLRPRSNPTEGRDTIKGLLMGDSTLALRQHFGEEGLAPSDDLPDHFGNELQLLSYYYAVEAQGAEDTERTVERRTSLVHDHLLKWVGMLTDRIKENERLGFYAAAAELTRSLLASEDSPS